jgi:hypothetical protein
VADDAAGTSPDQPCLHLHFDAQVDVGRIEPGPGGGMPKAFVADIHINCAAAPRGCGVAFAFPGIPIGLSFDEPRVSVDGTELRAPVRPVGAPDGFGKGLPSVGLRAVWGPE